MTITSRPSAPHVRRARAKHSNGAELRKPRVPAARTARGWAARRIAHTRHSRKAAQSALQSAQTSESAARVSAWRRGTRGRAAEQRPHGGRRAAERGIRDLMSRAAPRADNGVPPVSYNCAIIGHGRRVRSYQPAGSFAAVRRRPFGGQRLRRAADFRGA